MSETEQRKKERGGRSQPWTALGTVAFVLCAQALLDWRSARVHLGLSFGTLLVLALALGLGRISRFLSISSLPGWFAAAWLFHWLRIDPNRLWDAFFALPRAGDAMFALLQRLGAWSLPFVAFRFGSELDLRRLRVQLRSSLALALAPALVVLLLGLLALLLVRGWPALGTLPFLPKNAASLVSILRFALPLTLSFPLVAFAVADESETPWSPLNSLRLPLVAQYLLFTALVLLVDLGTRPPAEGGQALESLLRLEGLSIWLGAVLGLFTALGTLPGVVPLLRRLWWPLLLGLHVATGPFQLRTVSAAFAAGCVATHMASERELWLKEVRRFVRPFFFLFFLNLGLTLMPPHWGAIWAAATLFFALRFFVLGTGLGLGFRVGEERHGERLLFVLAFLPWMPPTATWLHQFWPFAPLEGFDWRALSESEMLLSILLASSTMALLIRSRGRAEQAEKQTAALAAAEREGIDGERLSFLPPADPWKSDEPFASPLLQEALARFRANLKSTIARRIGTQVAALEQELERFLSDLKEAYLARGLNAAGESEEETLVEFRLAQAEVVEAWRDLVHDRTLFVGDVSWLADFIFDGLDEAVDATPESLVAPFEEYAYRPPPHRSLRFAFFAFRLRAWRGLRRALGLPAPSRRIPLRRLARFHLNTARRRLLTLLPGRVREVEGLLEARLRPSFLRFREIHDELLSLDVGGQTQALKEGLGRQIDLAYRESFEALHQETEAWSQLVNAVLGQAWRNFENDLRRYGTPELRGAARQLPRRPPRAQENKSRLLALFEQGRQRRVGDYAQLAMELDLMSFEARMAENLQTYSLKLDRAIKSKGQLHLERSLETFARASSILEQALEQSHPVDAVREALRFLSQHTDVVLEEASRNLAELREGVSDEQGMALLREGVNQAAQSLRGRYRIPNQKKLEEGGESESKTQLLEVPVRELVGAQVETEVVPQLVTATRDLKTRLQRVENTLVETRRTLAFNAELVKQELELSGSERLSDRGFALLQEGLIGSLQRGRQTLEAQLREIGAIQQGVEASIWRSIRDHLRAFGGDLVDSRFSKNELDSLKRNAAGRRLLRRAIDLPVQLRRFKQEFDAALERTFGERNLRILQRKLGLRERHRNLRTTYEAFAEAETRVALPFVYRQLFSADALELSYVLNDYDREVDYANRVLASRSEGSARRLALVGIDGVGKSAVLNAIIRNRPRATTTRLNFHAPVSKGQLEVALRSSRGGELVVVDGMHWLIDSRPGGFQVLRSFLQRVLADRSRAWLVVADRMVWDYAIGIASADEVFPELIQVRSLTRSELQSAFLARHALSGYSLHFRASSSASTAIEELVQQATSRLRSPQDRYFDGLFDASGGRVRDAMRYWLASIRDFDEEKGLVRLGEAAESPREALRQLPEDILICLWTVVRQGWTDAQTQATLFRQSEAQAFAKLESLVHRGLLRREDACYRVTFHLRGAIAEMLREKGWAA